MLASGAGWRVEDLVCTAGPRDRPFEERHDGMCVAAVAAGTFQYRSPLGSGLLAPGALLLGNDGHCFECGHEHGTGDRCLSFHFAPAFIEMVAAALPGVRRAGFAASHLPPLPALIPVVAAAEAAGVEGDPAQLEELALQFAGTALAAAAGIRPAQSAPSRRDERRVAAALRRIEASAHEPMSLGDLAREASMSRYHFLRTFRVVTGLTPHQFTLRTRLHRAAVRLRRSGESISAIAFDVGFNDLSTFNRRFRRVTGLSPSAYRAARSARGHL